MHPYLVLLAIAIIIIIYMIWSDQDMLAEKYIQSLKILTRQAARWTTASKQDKNAMIAVLHANYGAGYLWALTDIATEADILKYTDIDIRQMRDEIITQQDNTTKNMAKLCPSYAPDSSYLTQIAGER